MQNMTFVDLIFAIELRLAEIVLRDLDLFLEGQIFESRPSHIGESRAMSASTAVLRVAPWPHKLSYSSKRSFKRDECEFKRDEGDICSKTNH